MALEFCHRIPKTIGVSGAGEGSFLNTLSTPLWLRGKESPSFGGAEEGGGIRACTRLCDPFPLGRCAEDKTGIAIWRRLPFAAAPPPLRAVALARVLVSWWR